MKKYGFIGVGNMGMPLLRGALQIVDKEMVAFTAKSEEKKLKTKAELGVCCCESNAQLAESSENIVLGIKPQFLFGVLEEISGVDLTGKTIISIAAGISCDQIRKALGQEVRIARVMPNTPAMVGEGMSCICFDAPLNGNSNTSFDDETKKNVTDIFEKIGKVEVIPEALMSAATCANGSSPAYVYMFIEALADSVVKYGIPRNTAYRLVAQTVLGSAKMVLETGEHPGRLKDNVCSPGGTTIAAVEALEEFGLRNAVMKATDVCYAKSESLAKKD